jgi:hypothetical protein
MSQMKATSIAKTTTVRPNFQARDLLQGNTLVSLHGPLLQMGLMTPKS